MHTIISDIADGAFEAMVRDPIILEKFIARTDEDISHGFDEFLLSVSGGHFFTRKGDILLDQDGVPGAPKPGLSYVSIGIKGTKVVTF